MINTKSYNFIQKIDTISYQIIFYNNILHDTLLYDIMQCCFISHSTLSYEL